MDDRSFESRRRGRTAAIAAFVVLCSIILRPLNAVNPAGSRPGQEVMAQRRHETSVILKLIHVYVTDKSGDPVDDLTLADFSATDNGRPVILTEFEKHVLGGPAGEVAGDTPVAIQAATAPAPAPAMNRKFFLFFDFAYNNARGITKAKTAGRHFLETKVGPEDEIGVITYSMIKGIVIQEYLTRDHDKIREILSRIDQSDISGRAHEIEQMYWMQAQEPLPAVRDGMSATQADLHQKMAESQRNESKLIAQTLIQRLTALAKGLRYVPGQKQFVFFSSGIPGSLIYGSQAGNTDGLGARSKFDPGDRTLRTKNEAMYREFSASGCTFYAFDTRESAKAADLFAYDAYTFETGNRGLFAANGVFQDSTDVLRDDKTTGLNSLKRLTDITGGRYFSNINMYAKNLDQVQELTGNYYVLGYAIGEQEDGRFHEVKVEVKRKGCQVRAQAGYFDPKPYREFTALEKQIHLFELALNERSFSRLPISFPVIALTFTAGDDPGLELLARVPGDLMGLYSGDGVEFVAVVFDEKNNVSDVRRVVAGPPARPDQAVVFTSAVSLGPGAYTCRLVIRDMASGLSAVGSVRASILRSSAQSLRLGTPLLLTDNSDCAFVDAGEAKPRAGIPWPGIYAYDRSRIAPVAGRVSRHEGRVLALVPFTVPGREAPIIFSAHLIDASTGEPEPVIIRQVGTSKRGMAQTVSLEIALAGLVPGRYLLYVNAEDPASRTLAYAQTYLIIADD